MPILSYFHPKPPVTVHIGSNEIQISADPATQISLPLDLTQSSTHCLKPTIEKLGLINRSCIIFLPPQQLIIKQLKLPLYLNEQECETEIAENLNQYLFEVKETLYFDFVIADEPKEDYQQIFVFAAKQSQITTYVNAITQASLRVIRVGADPAVLLKAIKWSFPDSFHGRGLHINLLPWRLAKQKKQRQFTQLSITIGLLVGLLLGGIGHIVTRHKLTALIQANSSLEKTQNKTQLLADKLSQLQNSYHRLTQQKTQLESLQYQQKRIGAAIREVVSLEQSAIFLKDISYTKEILTISGEITVLTQLKKLITQINQATYLSCARLKELKLLTSQQKYYFVLTAHLNAGVVDDG